MPSSRRVSTSSRVVVATSGPPRGEGEVIEGGGRSRPRSRSALVGLGGGLLSLGERPVQRLEVLGDHLDAAAGGSVLDLPGAAVEAALDVDQPALRQELAGEFRVLPPDHDSLESACQARLSGWGGRHSCMGRCGNASSVNAGGVARGQTSLGVLRPRRSRPPGVASAGTRTLCGRSSRRASRLCCARGAEPPLRRFARRRSPGVSVVRKIPRRKQGIVRAPVRLLLMK
jgi:hypothetical protein